MLEVTEVSKSFGSGGSAVAAVNGVTMTVADGEFVTIVGRSGSGKSTLMNLLGGLEQPTSGSIKVNGEEITRFSERQLNDYRAHGVGFVFQGYNLIPNLTAEENVMLAMELVGVGKSDRRKRARELLDQVELTGSKQTRKPGKLSGGEQQRVAIARALANQPKLILADEPAGNLDSQTAATIVELLRTLAHSQDATILVVTHDEAIAKHSDRTFRLVDGRLGEDDIVAR
ncbi:MAG TPA: ABC transporter ATP-binding protein [Frankiaceae bacterium]|jgi:putative ABC transport system ATP-binding protein|nr:ABC transporter ATP-binding protein [Frankiaceae bacterium]